MIPHVKGLMMFARKEVQFVCQMGGAESVGCLCPVVEIYVFVDKDQHTRKSELLLELVIYSTSASVHVAVALSVRAEDLSRE